MLFKNFIRKIYGRYAFNPLPMIALGFASIILLGSLLLTLPVASATGVRVPWFDALFTATSAVCVTGLVVVDTGTTYSAFGHVVLMILIQLGGLGFMTFATLILALMGRHISLRERMIMRDSMNEDGTGGMVKLVQWVAGSAFTVELVGAALFSIRFIPEYGFGKGLFYSVFHSISAFCNAGFDLFGGYRSLTGFRDDVLMNFTAIGLIIVGGLGFGALADIRKKKKFEKLRLHTKLVLVSYGFLLVFGFFMVLILEWNNPQTLGNLGFFEKMQAALFQSVTLRTAGFNTIDQQALRDCTKFISSGLMLVGAAPASTGGGIKVTTIAIAVLTVRMIARGESSIVVFKRRVDRNLIQRTMAILLIAVFIVMVDVCALMILQPGEDFLDLLYECASAMGTVGISAIGSAKLVPLSRVLIILTMFAGRIGPMSMALLLAHKQAGNKELVRYPEERIMIG